MEIIRDILKLEELKGYEIIESLIETDIYLNQGEADIEEILWVDGKIEILNSKIIKDKILVNGLVKFELAYKSNEEELKIYLLDSHFLYGQVWYLRHVFVPCKVYACNRV